MIYFVQLASGAIKIGHTDDLDQRLAGLTSHYGGPVALLATMPGDPEKEAEIHERFAHLRFGRKEQFRPARELLDFIDRPLLVAADPGSVEPNPCRPRESLPVVVAGTPDWKQWLEDYAASRRMTVPDLIDWALEEKAERDGFRRPPLRRKKRAS